MKRHPFFWGTFILLLLTFSFYSLSHSLLDEWDGEDGEKIAVVEVEGLISEPDDIVEELKKHGKDPSIKGVLLRINSPGGGVAASQEIYSQILRIRRENGKKVVASMSSLGASGGYYVACAADKIMANPGTITGSIGVIMPFSNIEALMGKIGLKADVIKSGEYKDIGSPTREMTSKEREILKASIDDVYGQFVEAISQGRNMDSEKIRTLADGRIYTGRQALEAGLIDRLGGFEDAVDFLVEIAGIQGEPVIIREEEEEGLLYRLVKGDAQSLLGRGILKPLSGFQYLWEY